MNVLIVDNHTSRINEIHIMLTKAKFDHIDTVRAEKLDPTIADGYDLVVLTGATGFAISTHRLEYRDELGLIKNRTKPLIGICSGFQALALAFGGELHYRTESIKGVIDVNVVTPSPIFGNHTQFRAYVSHKYYISESPIDFITLAKSEFNIEAIKHKSLPLYGFQFHPEVTEPENDGYEIFNRFVELAVTKKVATLI